MRAAMKLPPATAGYAGGSAPRWSYGAGASAAPSRAAVIPAVDCAQNVPCTNHNPGAAVGGGCLPCNVPAGEKFNCVDHTTHDHGDCMGQTGAMDHWHYDVFNQNPATCACYCSAHRFGGCGHHP